MLQDFETSPPPKILYHYTGLVGLQGALSGAVLRRLTAVVSTIGLPKQSC